MNLVSESINPRIRQAIGPHPGTLRFHRVCDIISVIKQGYDSNRLCFDQQGKVPYQHINTKAKFIRDVLIHDIVSSFGLPGPIRAEDNRDRRRQMKRRTTAIWDMCLELSETKQVARGYAGCERSRMAWIGNLPQDYLNFLKGKLKYHQKTSLLRLLIT